MHIDRAQLESRFRDMSDEELLRHAGSDALTPLALEVVMEETARRNLAPLPRSGKPASSVDLPAGALRVCAIYLDPIAAEALRVRLLAEGLSPQNHYANGGVFGNVGLAGVRVMVPESQIEPAERIRARFDAGEYAIDEDFDVGK